jgi:hypothetical protein
LLINMPSTFIHIPTHLIIEQRTSPLALGIYTLIARLVVYHKRPTGLSQADIMAYDTKVVRGSVIRALEKLHHNRWVVGEKGSQGAKANYLPTWGLVAGTILPWDPQDTSPPEAVATTKIHSQLLDSYIGVLVPHPQGVLIERPHDQPLLHLRDVGVYLTALAGYPGSTPNLTQQKLIIGDKVQPVS